MQFLKNILSVSKYESKLLYRSWFFKVFATLAIAASFFVLITTSTTNAHAVRSIPSLLAYDLLLLFNVGQAIVSIFLASEYLKRDKQLDTSEIFYVRPLGNAEYLLGKMWGTIKVFLLLNFVIIAIGMVYSAVSLNTNVDIRSFIIYFLFINLPTLVYIIGLSTILMLIIKNQALTFVILLGYIGLTVFYIGDKCYYIFDYMCYNIPLLESTITGVADLEALIVHRLFYFLLGIGFILCSILMFRRLPNSRFSLYPWGGLAFTVLLMGAVLGYKHVSTYIIKERFQQEMIALNNRHVHDAKIVTDSCYMEIEQELDILRIKAYVTGHPAQKDSVFVFTLNPGFDVTSVTHDGKQVPYRRNAHLLHVTMPEQYTEEEWISMTIQYEGKIDERICYLDISEEVLLENSKLGNFNIGKRYAYQSEDYTLLTPESYWYPRPGVCFSDESPDWQQCYFTQYGLTVKPNKGLTALSQGYREVSADSLYTYFMPEYPLQSITLAIGKYHSYSVNVDGTEYAAWYLEGHDFFSEHFSLLEDTIPSIIRDARSNAEMQVDMPYPFYRFSIVEVPAHFLSYSRTWTRAQENMQPEMVLIPEKGFNIRRFDIAGHISWRKGEQGMGRGPGARGPGGGSRGGGRGGRVMTEHDIQMEAFNNMIRFMFDTNGGVSFQEGSLGRNSVSITESPYYFFPQMYNFKYNIYSSEWPVANRLMELTINSSNMWQNNWVRQTNGLSGEEKVLLLLQEASFKDLLGDSEHRDLINNLIEVQARQLFLEAEKNMGIKAFADTLRSHVLANAFCNLSFEALLDTLSYISGADLHAPLKTWDVLSNQMAEFEFGTPTLTKVETKDMELYEYEFVVSNTSPVEGNIHIRLDFWQSEDGMQTLNGEEKETEWIVTLAPFETKRVVSHWEEMPNSATIKALYSRNLPILIWQQGGRAEESTHLTEEGEYILSKDYLDNPDEVIVDNEDSLLFELSVPPASGLLHEWISQTSEDDDFKYAGVNNWRAPSRWTFTTDGAYYGRSIRSAVVIRSGKGEQYAMWKIPVPKPGTYELYYYLRKPEELRWGRGRQFYHFNIQNGTEEEQTELNLRRASDGWTLIDSYRVDSDTLYVKLTDESELRMITADAVKLAIKY